MAVLEVEDREASPLVPSHITRLRPYIPGKPIEQVQIEFGLTDVCKLASNENPLGQSPKALDAMRSAAMNVAFYPDGSSPYLASEIAERLGIGTEYLTFGNGSDEILHLLCQTFLVAGEDNLLQANPSFAMYEIYGTLANAEVVKVPVKDYKHDLEAMADAVTDHTKLVFIANPNNPTGTIVTQKEVERFLDRIPENIVTVFDEAYYEYVDDPEFPKILPFVLEGRNVVITRTFSKAYGLAGLRIGYGIARPEISGYLNRGRSPFNINTIAQAAALAALKDDQFLAHCVASNRTVMGELTTALQQRGLEFIPSHTNFLLIDIRRDSRAVFDKLQRLGCIVRPGTGLGFPHHIRVSIGTSSQIAQFLTALDQVLSET